MIRRKCCKKSLQEDRQPVDVNELYAFYETKQPAKYNDRETTNQHPKGTVVLGTITLRVRAPSRGKKNGELIQRSRPYQKKEERAKAGTEKKILFSRRTPNSGEKTGERRHS